MEYILLFCTTLILCLCVDLIRRFQKHRISMKGLSESIYLHGDIGFLSFNMNGRLIALNDVAKQIVGINSPDNQRITDVFDLSGVSEAVTSEITGVDENKEYHILARKTNSVCSAFFQEIKDSKGEPYCIVCAVYDRSKEEVILENIRKAGDAKSSFLASMTHEIRTPINAILGMCEMINREGTNEEILGYARSMDKSGEQLLSIVNDVLDYSKIQSGRMELIPVRYDLRELLHQLIINYETVSAKKGIKFQYDVNEELPIYLYGDEVRILQILKNLLSNAVKYTDNGEITFIAYSRKNTEEQVTLLFEVRDTGKGIKEEEQVGLFDIFMRADHDKNQTIAGAGIGLPIVNSLLQLMGGNINVESEYGKGSVFRVELPQKIVSYHQIGDYSMSLLEYKAEHTSNLSCQYTAPAASILIVDDNKINLSVAKYLLQKTKAKIDTAASGKEAIEMIKKFSYQIVFLDHLMPEMDGIETIKEIRKAHLADEVPIIALTANAIAGAKEMYLDYGFQDYLSKPITKDSLEKKVHDWLPPNYIHYEDSSNGMMDNRKKQGLSINRLPLDFKSKVINNESVMQGICQESQLIHVFIINPIVVSEKKTKEIREFLSQIKDLKYFVFTSNEQGAETELTRKIQKYLSCEMLRIYCIGGSGTIRNVMNGIEDFEKVEVAFCPMGMTNDFLKVFGNEKEKFGELENLIYGEVERIDYIQTTGGIALNTFSLGLDANIVEKLEKNRIFKVFGKMTPYVLSFLYSLFISTPDEYEIYLDDELVYEGVSSEIIFGNGIVLGGMFTFGGSRHITDGKGVVLIAKKHQGMALLPTIMAMVTEKTEKLSQNEIVREASSFTIRRKDGGKLAMNFDGEMVYGLEKWEARIIRKGLKFVVPRGVTIDE